MTMWGLSLSHVLVAMSAFCFGVGYAANGFATCYEDGGFKQSEWPHCFRAADNVLAYSGKQGTTQMKLGMWAEKSTEWSPGTSGTWTALAISGNGGMKGAREIVVRKVGSNHEGLIGSFLGDWIAEDRFSQAYEKPILSSSQDVQLVSAGQVNDGIFWSVLLPMNACKGDVDGLPSNYPLDEDIERFMLFALGVSNTFQYHSHHRGSFHANLFSGPVTPPSIEGLQQVSITMPEVKVAVGPQGTHPSNPYVCGIFDLSQLFAGRDISKKHHVAQFAATLSPNSGKYVHHMILYGCQNSMARMQGFTHGQVITDCESMPRGCYEMKWPWAVGSKPVTFPLDVGMPFGEGKGWVALQMHYYNPDLDTNVVDSSGVTLALTSIVRPVDAAVLTFNGGTSDETRDPMPKGQKEVNLNFFVPKDCTSQWSAPHVNVIGTVYHAHLLGVHLNIDVIHDGTYAGVLRRENYYDFNHQSIEEGPIKKIYKGDALKMTCKYNTVSAKSDVRFGDLTQTEMCWAAALYYPAQKVSDFNYGSHMSKPTVGCGEWSNYYSRVDEPAPMVPTCQVVGEVTTGTVTTTARVGTTDTSNAVASLSKTRTLGFTCLVTGSIIWRIGSTLFSHV